MTKLKKIVALGTMVLTVGATSMTVFAASNNNILSEVVAQLTGRTVESVMTEKNETGKTYGLIADEAGKLTEFKAEMLENKKEILDEKVAAGIVTQEEADEILKAIEENQVNCDGTGSARIAQNRGAGFGAMNGNGQGNGQRGAGRGMGGCQGGFQVQ